MLGCGFRGLILLFDEFFVLNKAVSRISSLVAEKCTTPGFYATLRLDVRRSRPCCLTNFRRGVGDEGLETLAVGFSVEHKRYVRLRTSCEHEIIALSAHSVISPCNVRLLPSINLFIHQTPLFSTSCLCLLSRNLRGMNGRRLQRTAAPIFSSLQVGTRLTSIQYYRRLMPAQARRDVCAIQLLRQSASARGTSPGWFFGGDPTP
jgi:hypothetical protein